MATVRNTIALQDRMTPVLRSIIRALDTTVDCLAQVDNISSRNFERMRSSVSAASQAVEDLNNNVEDTQDPVDRVKSGFSKWQSAIVTANQAIGLLRSGVEAVGKVTGFLDSMTNMSSRVNLVNDGLQEQSELQEKIYQSAQRSRASYQETSAAVAKMNLLAGGVFSSNDQAIKFVETMNKAFVLSGADSSEQASALRQMSQAMASGRLQGDEYNSIIENAPLIAQAIEKYMGVSRGELKELASEGQITSEVILAAVEQASVGIDQQFEEMPVTFGQAMTQVKNTAMMELGPIVSRFSDFLQSNTFQSWVAEVSSAISSAIAWVQSLVDTVSILANSHGAKALVNDFRVLGNILAHIISFAVSLVTVFIDNWGWIEPIVWGVVGAFLAYQTVIMGCAIAQGVTNALIAAATFLGTVHRASLAMQTGATFAATAAQYGFNAALLACPLTWILLIILAVIVAIYAIVAAINKVTGSTLSATGLIFGTILTVVAIIWNTIIGVINGIIQLIWALFVEPFIGYIEFILNVANGGFNSFGDAVANLIGNVIGWFLSLGQVVTKIIDAIFGTNWTAGLESMKSSVIAWGKNEQAITLSREAPTIESMTGGAVGTWNYNDAFATGYGFGEYVDDSIGDMASGISGLNESALNANELAAETLNLAEGEGVAVKGSVEIDEDTISLLKDVAAVEWVNKYTTLRPELNVSFGDVHETADTEGLLAAMEDMIEEAYASALVGEG